VIILKILRIDRRISMVYLSSRPKKINRKEKINNQQNLNEKIRKKNSLHLSKG
jgi:hypothetical protein